MLATPTDCAIAYNITCREDMPVVNVGNRGNPSYLPADVCQVISGQPATTKLTPSQTQQMIRFAVRRPAQNAQSIVTNGARILGLQPATNTILVSVAGLVGYPC
jgi:hypothetical protein